MIETGILDFLSYIIGQGGGGGTLCSDLRPYSIWTGEAQYFACQNIVVGYATSTT